MLGNVYGLDLGTYEIKIYDKKNDKISKEKNTVAIKGRKELFAAGNEAYEMYEKAPAGVQIIFPMKDGVIAHFNNMQYLLGSLLGEERRFSRGDEYVLAVPTDVTEVEKKAFYDLVHHSEARARSVRIVEKGLADAVGFGRDVFEEKGVFVANFGGATTELSVLSSGGIVLNRLLKVGGEDFDQAIAGLVRHNQDFLIGRQTAERLRREFGIFDQSADAAITVAGRDLLSGVPSQTEVSISLVRAAMKELLEECVRAVRSMIDRTPPDVRNAIFETGICLTGGIAHLKGLSTYLRESTGLPVTTIENPELCAVNGLRKIISDREYYKKLTYSMRDKNYRW